MKKKASQERWILSAEGDTGVKALAVRKLWSGRYPVSSGGAVTIPVEQSLRRQHPFVFRVSFVRAIGPVGRV